MRNAVVQILNATDTTSRTGAAFNTNQVVSASFHVYFTVADGAGTVRIQASNDLPPNGQLSTFVPTNWVDIPGATVSVTAGGAFLITVAQMCYQSIRAIHTNTTPGTGNVVVNMNILSV